MELPNEHSIEIEPGLRRMILIEIIFPMVLLILGIYHGLMQVLYRAGIIRSSQFLGTRIFPGPNLARRHKRDRLHHLLCRRIRLRGHSLLSAPAPQHEGGVVVVCAHDHRHAARRRRDSLREGNRPLHVLSAAARPSRLLCRSCSCRGRFLDRVLQLVAALLCLETRASRAKMPLAVVGIFATFIVWLIATAPVAIEILFLLIPWSMGWVATVNVPLARMLFWFFGHPLVYFWLLPAYVMYYTMLPKLAGGKLFSDFAGRLTFLWLVLYSAPVGIHHQFTETGNQRHLEIRPRLFYHAGCGPKFRYRVYHGRVDGTWRARRRADAACSDGGRSFPTSTRIAGCFPISLPDCSSLSLAELPGSSTPPTTSTTSCITPPGCRRISIKLSPARFFFPISA